jgi:hypothetical protein
VCHPGKNEQGAANQEEVEEKREERVHHVSHIRSISG